MTGPFLRIRNEPIPKPASLINRSVSLLANSPCNQDDSDRGSDGCIDVDLLVIAEGVLTEDLLGSVGPACAPFASCGETGVVEI